MSGYWGRDAKYLILFGAGDGIRTHDPNLGKVVLRGIAAAGAIAASRADIIAARYSLGSWLWHRPPAVC